MKRFYFVRHGESNSNATGIMEGPVAMLSEKGEAQAVKVAERLSRIEFDCIISSPWPRALETAQAIKSRTQVPLEECVDLHEKIHPSSIIGTHFQDEKRRRVDEIIRERQEMGDAHFHHSDEESFEDMRLRAERVQKFLEARKEDNVVVVSHGTFLRFLHAHLQLRELLNPQLFVRLLNNHRTSNTGITIYEYLDEESVADVYRWKLRTWMDIAHLAD
jgi:broad specificity phosphatase PhoE